MLPQSEVFSRLLTILLLIAINAFFVAAEFSVVSVRQTRIQQLVQEGDLQARTVQNLQRDLERLLSTTQIGITLSSLALGWIGEKAIAQMLFGWMNATRIAPDMRNWVAHAFAIPVAFMAIAYLQIVLGELFPKTLALAYSEKLARVLGPISLSISRLFTPLVWVLNQSNRLLLRLFRVPVVQDNTFNTVTAKELQLILESSSEQSDLQEEERELLRNVFESGEVLVEEVMVPRTSINPIEAQSTLQEFLEEVSKTGHDYYPVIDESLDQIRGTLYYKDVVRELPFHSLDFNASIQPWIQTAWFVPEGTPIQNVLQMMQKYKLGVIMVRESEFNGTAGLVTLQDLIRAIIGIEDEALSPEEESITEQDNHTFVIQAQTDLEAINEQLGIQLPILEDYQTLGGFIMFHLQRIPETGELFHYENLEIKILSAQGPRIGQVLIHIADLPDTFIPESDVN
ncbi:hemolysin family protein [Altericista sp. CCNU0014]|uniref:hemolysin family protein n=1 Tax=Altericista sp. CCNU0014 TaxID=3082949 RepID=UPI0038501340